MQTKYKFFKKYTSIVLMISNITTISTHNTLNVFASNKLDLENYNNDNTTISNISEVTETELEEPGERENTKVNDNIIISEITELKEHEGNENKKERAISSIIKKFQNGSHEVKGQILRNISDSIVVINQKWRPKILEFLSESIKNMDEIVVYDILLNLLNNFNDMQDYTIMNIENNKQVTKYVLEIIFDNFRKLSGLNAVKILQNISENRLIIYKAITTDSKDRLSIMVTRIFTDLRNNSIQHTNEVNSALSNMLDYVQNSLMLNPMFDSLWWVFMHNIHRLRPGATTNALLKSIARQFPSIIHKEKNRDKVLEIIEDYVGNDKINDTSTEDAIIEGLIPFINSIPSQEIQNMLLSLNNIRSRSYNLFLRIKILNTLSSSFVQLNHDLQRKALIFIYNNIDDARIIDDENTKYNIISNIRSNLNNPNLSLTAKFLSCVICLRLMKDNSYDDILGMFPKYIINYAMNS